MNKLFTLNAFVFYFIAAAGIVGHVVKRWAFKEINTTITDWFVTNKQTTVAMMLGVYGALILLVANDAANNYNDLMQVIAVFSLGYVGNSTINTDKGV